MIPLMDSPQTQKSLLVEASQFILLWATNIGIMAKKFHTMEQQIEIYSNFMENMKNIFKIQRLHQYTVEEKGSLKGPFI